MRASRVRRLEEDGDDSTKARPSAHTRRLGITWQIDTTTKEVGADVATRKGTAARKVVTVSSMTTMMTPVILENVIRTANGTSAADGRVMARAMARASMELTRQVGVKVALAERRAVGEAEAVARMVAGRARPEDTAVNPPEAGMVPVDTAAGNMAVADLPAAHMEAAGTGASMDVEDRRTVGAVSTAAVIRNLNVAS
jgi:hypothetical protein